MLEKILGFIGQEKVHRLFRTLHVNSSEEGKDSALKMYIAHVPVSVLILIIYWKMENLVYRFVTRVSS